MRMGYYHVKLDEDSKPLTAVRTVLGLLQYTRLPQGLKNSPGMFQRIVNLILGERKGKDVLSYFDDTSAGAETGGERLKSLDEILSKLYENGACLKLSKYYFEVREVEVLGHEVSKEGLLPSHGHVFAIRALLKPASGDE